MSKKISAESTETIEKKQFMEVQEDCDDDSSHEETKKSSCHSESSSWSCWFPLILFIIFFIIIMIVAYACGWGSDGCGLGWSFNQMSCAILLFFIVWLIILGWFCWVGNTTGAWFFFLLIIALVIIWMIASALGRCTSSYSSH